jgi:hypothetical protein
METCNLTRPYVVPTMYHLKSTVWLAIATVHVAVQVGCQSHSASTPMVKGAASVVATSPAQDTMIDCAGKSPSSRGGRDCFTTWHTRPIDRENSLARHFVADGPYGSGILAFVERGSVATGQDLVARVRVLNSTADAETVAIWAVITMHTNAGEVTSVLISERCELEIDPRGSFETSLTVPVDLYAPLFGPLIMISAQVRAVALSSGDYARAPFRLSPKWPEAKVEADVSRPIYIGFDRPLGFTVTNHLPIQVTDLRIHAGVSGSAEGSDRLELLIPLLEPGDSFSGEVAARGQGEGKASFSVVAVSSRFEQRAHTTFDVAYCPADFNRDGRVTAEDRLAFEEAISTGDPRADLAGDGIIGSRDDRAIFQRFYQGGCE